jgi:UDP-N-acetyl-D-glucosamine dehydrogenase
MGIDIWDVIDAAKTKPFGFMPFYPGPGLGGHCIPIDPFYFSWKAKQYNLEPRFIETAGYINSQMPHYVVSKVQDALNMDKIALNGAEVHLLGVTYKKDIDDVRESPAIDVAHLLIEKGASLTYYDPYVPEVRVIDTTLKSTAEPWSGLPDCVVILADHSSVDYYEILEKCREKGTRIVDTRNALKGLTDSKIVRL